MNPIQEFQEDSRRQKAMLTPLTEAINNLNKSKYFFITIRSKWQSRRKMLTPTFHFKILEDFMEVFNQQSNKLVKNLQRNVDGKPFDIFRYVTLCTLDIILETAMGRSINAQDNENSDYVTAIYEIGRLFMERQTRPWLQIGLIYNLLGKKCMKRLNRYSGRVTEKLHLPIFVK
ncbi:hypothetical protein Anas_06628 [Armadillidium nasatum]|uniref:Uncharacterized protein n=1 Tax=Armadillidium nasatum TaxID=96803 RepID=A0A5N5SYZ4_9CRUS|nr:hypothetical protein Anas_06628 [Armadillidium nasatum]